MTRAELFNGYRESVPVIFLHIAKTYRLACSGRFDKRRRREDISRMLLHLTPASEMRARNGRST